MDLASNRIGSGRDPVASPLALLAAERAISIAPRAKLHQLVGDMVQLENSGHNAHPRSVVATIHTD